LRLPQLFHSFWRAGSWIDDDDDDACGRNDDDVSDDVIDDEEDDDKESRTKNRRVGKPPRPQSVSKRVEGGGDG